MLKNLLGKKGALPMKTINVSYRLTYDGDITIEVPDDFNENNIADVERKLLYDYGEWKLNAEADFEDFEVMDVEVEDE